MNSRALLSTCARRSLLYSAPNKLISSNFTNQLRSIKGSSKAYSIYESVVNPSISQRWMSSSAPKNGDQKIANFSDFSFKKTIGIEEMSEKELIEALREKTEMLKLKEREIDEMKNVTLADLSKDELVKRLLEKQEENKDLRGYLRFIFCGAIAWVVLFR